MLEDSSAVSLIKKVAEAYRRQFRELMTAYQNAGDPEETIRLRDQLVGEVFGSSGRFTHIREEEPRAGRTQPIQ
jgi:hypothetical protein